MQHGILSWIWDEALLHQLVAGFPTLVLVLGIAFCIVVLSQGADWMIHGVVHLARRTGLPKIVIAATIVSLGTTTPEAFVSVMAAWMGNPGLALGNGVGSIIADTGLIFGLICFLTPVPMNRYMLNRTGWVQVGSATLLVVFSLMAFLTATGEPRLERWVGIVLLILLVAYLYAALVWARQGGALSLEGEAEDHTSLMGIGKCWVLILGGLLLVLLGARVLIPCASEIAHRMGVPDDIIACTLVAFGTSLPELVTAIVSVRRGHPEIMVGNVVGADVLNCLFVIGAAAAATPLAIPANFYTFHFPTMILILYSFRTFIFLNRRKGVFSRWQGGWLLGVYLIYVILQYSLNVGTVG